MQTGFENISLQTDLAVCRNYAALRHATAKIAAFFDANLFGPDITRKRVTIYQSTSSRRLLAQPR